MSVFPEVIMKIFPFLKTLPVVAAGIAAVIVSCHFPYDPEPFVLPEPPYMFPSRTDIQTFFDTTNVKLAYTLRESSGPRTVYFVDFNDSAPSPKKLKKPAGKENINADSPLLSPDGAFAAYYLTDNLNIYGAYIQRLDVSADPVLVASYGTEPHWWKDSSGQVSIVFSDQMLVSSLGPNIGKTYRQQVSLTGNGSLVEAVEEIAPYPMNGGLSSDGRYLCTGYAPAAFYDLVTQQLTLINQTFQVCNPSIDPDSSHPDRMMFLNFYGKQNMTNPFRDSADYPADAGGNVPQHAVLFIADVSNTVIDFVPLSIMGGGYQEWQDPEWSNNPAYAAALALIDDSSADGVFIKNVGTRPAAKQKLVFTRGRGKLNVTSTPFVWIGN
jgi:hypothetical protein